MSLQNRLRNRLQVVFDGCWEFQGYCTPKGYGTLSRGAREEGVVFAHRAAWEIANGSIPHGMNVLHKCDNPPCCNPAHLFLGTQAQNMADMVAKGRESYVRGEDNGMAKLTWEKAQAIRTDPRPQREIAKEYGVHQMTISKVKRGETWKEAA